MKAKKPATNLKHPDATSAGVFACIEPKSLRNRQGEVIWGRKVRSKRGMCLVYPNKPKSKLDCMRWSGNVDATTRMMFADFDSLPSMFGGRRGSWKVFADYLRHRVGNNGVVFGSFGGRVKVGFLFDITTSKGAAIAEMRSIIGEEIYNHVDHQATDHTIVVFNAIDDINSHIANGVVLCGHDENINGWNFKNTPEAMTAIKRFTRSSTRKVYHWLLSFRGQSMDLSMPVKKIADDCGISIASVSCSISSLEEAGIIRCIDESYVVGRRAKMYRVIDANSLKIMESKNPKAFKGIASIDVDQFVDGNWFNALWNHTRLFTTGVEFMLFVHGIEGAYAHGKHRIAKARSAWRSHAKRNGLSLEVC